MATSHLPSDIGDASSPPPALLPYQQRWVADESPLKIAEKSRRIGLTWAEASDDVLQAAKMGGTNVFYIGPTQDMALEFVEACAMWARVFDFAASRIEEGLWTDGDREIKTYKIDFPKSGKRIVALSSRPTNLRGKQGIIVIDEAAFHNDLAELLKAAMAMLLWGGKVRLISTHDGIDNAFAELIADVRGGRRKGSVHRITFMDAVLEGLYKRVCLRRGVEWSQAAQDAWVADAYAFYGDGAAEELDVVPSQSGGSYLSMGLIESRMSADTPLVRGRWTSEFALLSDHERAQAITAWCDENLLPHLVVMDASLWYSFGQDFGRVGDLSVLVLLAEQANLSNRVALQVELSNCPFTSQEQVLYYILDRVRRLRGAALDSTGNGAFLGERAMQKYGSTKVAQVHMSEGWYLENWPRTKAALEDNELSGVPKDAQARDDLRAVRLINGVPKLPKVKTQRGDGQRLQRHGDSAIALVLAHSAMRNEAAPVEFQQLGVQRVGSSLADYMGAE
jgi:phage FluMu gp28-like protein